MVISVGCTELCLNSISSTCCTSDITCDITSQITIDSFSRQYIGVGIVGQTTIHSQSSTCGGIRAIRHYECKSSVGSRYVSNTDIVSHIGSTSHITNDVTNNIRNDMTTTTNCQNIC